MRDHTSKTSSARLRLYSLWIFSASKTLVRNLTLLGRHYGVRGTLTAPVGIKVSVEVDSVAVVVDRAVLPPHSVLRQTIKIHRQGEKSCIILNHYAHKYHCCCVHSHCCPCVTVSIRVHHRQDINIHVIQNGSDVWVDVVKRQGLWRGKTKFND